MNNKIGLFPGQGSQKPGMGKEFFERYRDWVEIADECLGVSFKELCLNDPDGLLNRTDFTQPALFAVSAMTWRSMQESGDADKIIAAAGHSVGEYTALFAAGAIDFETGLRLTRRRGELMNQATDGGMAAVIGLGVDEIRDAIDNFQFNAIDVANLNSQSQTVISGSREELDELCPILEEAGARMVVRLKVSGAFHSRFMRPSGEAFQKTLNAVDFRSIRFPVYSNVTAAPAKSEQFSDLLTRQIYSPVRWVDIVLSLLDQFPEAEFVEIGPGKTLTQLLVSIRKERSNVVKA